MSNPAHHAGIAGPSRFRKHAAPVATVAAILAGGGGFWQAETIRQEMRAQAAATQAQLAAQAEALRGEMRATGDRLEKRLDRYDERLWDRRAQEKTDPLRDRLASFNLPLSSGPDTCPP